MENGLWCALPAGVGAEMTCLVFGSALWNIWGFLLGNLKGKLFEGHVWAKSRVFPHNLFNNCLSNLEAPVPPEGSYFLIPLFILPSGAVLAGADKAGRATWLTLLSLFPVLLASLKWLLPLDPRLLLKITRFGGGAPPLCWSMAGSGITSSWASWALCKGEKERSWEGDWNETE